ncbi:c-type cytochrome biogenesis protein CcmI [Glaciecola sp. SC05]|uniref:c-type cytochrome biogenesis protein CcmI n=1 Tax=Glaciecola sp. SC05 TaxID=1987355 RepID=UPI0035272A17
MSNFYIYSALLIALSSLFVIIPLLRKAKLNQLQVSNANVVKQRMTELEQEVTEGLISEKDKVSSIRDLKLALVEESDIIDDNTAVATGKVNWLLAALLALPAVVLGAWVYFNANQLSGLQEYIAAQTQAADLTARIQGQTGAEVTPNDYAKFALVIRKRLRDTPDDVEGWRLLGQVQMAIGRMEESIAAFEKALDIEPRNLAIREKYAQALMAAGSEDTLNNAKRQVEYLLSLAPDNRDYRLLLTVVATQLGDADVALSNFLMIRNELSGNSNFYQSLVAQLINIGVPAELLNDEALAQTGEPDSLQGKDISAQSDSGSSQSQAIDADGVGLELTVSITPDMAAKLPSDGFLIVFAQNAESESRIPLAVKRISLGSFPVTVSLSDSDAMMPSMTLSSVNKAKITARISKDADVMTTAGELQGHIERLDLVKGQILKSNIVINEELQ